MNRPNKLSFFGRQLKLDREEDIAAVVREINEHENLEILDFRGNTISVLAGERIAEAISTRPELVECIWGDMFTGRLKDEIPKVIDSLGAALTNSQCRLTTLDLSDNAFGAGLSDCLSNFLQSPALFNLENLIMNNNGLGLAGVTVGDSLCRLLQASREANQPLKLKKFVCGRNRLEITSTIALTNAFIMIQTLEEIYLPQNGIRGEAIDALAQAFSMNTNLRVIDLNDNTVKPEGCLEFCDVLPSLTKLEVLDLGSCLLEDEGAVAIIGGLEACHQKLQRIVLSGNSISGDVVDEIGTFFSQQAFRHVRVELAENALGRHFDTARAKYANKTNIDFGDKEDDEGGDDSEEEAEQMPILQESDELPSAESSDDHPEDASMEEDPNTSRGTVINRSQNEGQDMTEEMISKMLSTGIGCIKIAESEQNKQAGIVSFLDRSLKLDTAESAHEVVRTIRSYPVMKVFELRGNTLGKGAGDAIAAAMERHPELERCLWSDMFTGRLKHEIPPILEALGKAMIKAGCKIRELDLSDNAFGPIGADALKEFLESPSAFSLDTLRLNNNGLGIGGKQIAKSLTACLQNSIAAGGETRLRLKTFVAGRNRLENPGAIALAATFKELETIEWFDVRQNGINKPGIDALVDGLKRNLNLRHLWLEDNTILPKGARNLAKTLVSWPKLEVLNLSDCLLRDAGCNYIVDYLDPVVHRQLKNVYLCGNEMTPPCALLLMEKWSKFNVLNPKPILHIHTNCFGDFYGDVAENAPENVNVGEEDDDLGSLDGDVEEYVSRSSSDDADLESAAEDADESEQENLVQLSDDDDEEVQVESTETILKKSMDLIDQLDIDFESRFQEETAKVILQLAKPLQSCKMDPAAFNRAVEVAENIVVRVASVKRNPIPTTTQLINNIVAQCKGSGVKPEVDWGYNADPAVISRILRELVSRGHFKHETQLIQRFFTSQT